MASSLDHIEKTLADAYRKEIDQEENIWRSLPFFAATLALELAAILQISGHLPPAGTATWWISIGSIAVAGVASLTALGFLAGSIYPARFAYLAPGPELLEYALELDEIQRRTAASRGAEPIDALAELKEFLAHQYADAAHHNNRINRRRGLWRSIAGLATLVGILSIIALVASAAAHYVCPG